MLAIISQRCRLAVAAVLVLSAPVGAQTWTGFGYQVNNDWSYGPNWSGNAPPSQGSTTSIIFDNGPTAQSNNNLGTFDLHAMTFQTPMAVTGGTLNFRSFVFGTTFSPTITQSYFNPVSIQNNLSLSSTDFYLQGQGAGDLTLSGVVGGAATLHVTSPYYNTFLSNGGNNYTGGTVVQNGNLNTDAIGALPPGRDVTVQARLLNLNGFNQSIGNLTLSDPSATSSSAAPVVLLGSARLTLNGGVTYNPPLFNAPGASITGGSISLGGAIRTFNIGVGASTYDTVIGSLIVGPGGLTKTGDGALALTGGTSYTGPTTVTAGVLFLGVANALSSAVVVNGPAFLSLNTIATVQGVTVGSYNQSFGSLAGSSGSLVSLGSATLTVGADNTSTSYAGNLQSFNGAALVKVGTGTLTLTNNNTTFRGSIAVSAGGLTVAADNSLGVATAPVTVGTLATLTYSGTSTTARTLTLNSGTLAVSPGQTLTFANATVSGGFLTGGFATQAGSSNSFVGGNTTASAVLAQNGTGDTFTNFSNGGQFTTASSASATLTRFTNTSSGRLTVNGTVNTSDFVSDGQLTVNPGGSLNNSGSDVYLGGGSRTFIGSPLNSGGVIDLAGRNLTVAGGLLVNNGALIDSTFSTSVVTADFGALIKGSGAYVLNHPVTTINGGRFQVGNSPGRSPNATFTFSGNGQSSGVNNYLFQITNANGPAGPAPDTSGHVSGYSLIDVHPIFSVGTGNFSWTATPGAKLAFAAQTMADPATVGDSTTGMMAGFNSSQSYQWTVLQFTGTYSGPTAPLTPGGLVDLTGSTNFDFSQFSNATNGGTFGLLLDQGNKTLSLQFSPVPEPAHVLALSLAGLLAGGRCWRRIRSSAAGRSS